MKYLILLLFLTGCLGEYARVYPGNHSFSSFCYDLWVNHYEIDIALCEKKTDNPKYKLGESVKFKNKYAKNCKGIVVGNHRWSLTNEVLYTYKVYCDEIPLHDKHCENGNLLNCPNIIESELK